MDLAFQTDHKEFLAIVCEIHGCYKHGSRRLCRAVDVKANGFYPQNNQAASTIIQHLAVQKRYLQLFTVAPTLTQWLQGQRHISVVRHQTSKTLCTGRKMSVLICIDTWVGLFQQSCPFLGIQQMTRGAAARTPGVVQDSFHQGKKPAVHAHNPRRPIRHLRQFDRLGLFNSLFFSAYDLNEINRISIPFVSALCIEKTHRATMVMPI